MGGVCKLASQRPSLDLNWALIGRVTLKRYHAAHGLPGLRAAHFIQATFDFFLSLTAMGEAPERFYNKTLSNVAWMKCNRIQEAHAQHGTILIGARFAGLPGLRAAHFIQATFDFILNLTAMGASLDVSLVPNN